VKRKYLIFFIVLIAFFLLLIFRQGYYPWEHISCIFSRGDYQGLAGPLGSPPLGFKCVHTFSDAGKKCFSNNDCQGNCLVTKDTIVEKTGLLKSKVTGGFGACEANDLRYPSYPGDFENPQGWII